MRKLAKFVLIVFAITFVVAVGCAVSNAFKTMTVKALTLFFGTIYVTLSNSWAKLATTVGSSGTYFLIYTCGILLCGGILLVVFNRTRNRLPTIRQKTPTAPSLSTPSSAPALPALPTANPTLTTNPSALLEPKKATEEE